MTLLLDIATNPMLWPIGGIALLLMAAVPFAIVKATLGLLR